MKIEDASCEKPLMQKIVNLVSFDEGIEQKDFEIAKQANIRLLNYQDVLERGRKLKLEGKTHMVEPKPDDVYLFSYTSGTTGDPKGVKLTHKMILGVAFSVQSRTDNPMTENDCVISYLPAAHSFEQGC